MRTIVIINDNSSHAKHAAEATLYIAQKHKANLLLANLVGQKDNIKANAGIVHAYAHDHEDDESHVADLATYLKMRQITGPGHKPVITNLDALNLNEIELADLLNKHNAAMVIHGCEHNSTNDIPVLDPFSLLNVIKCPLMLMPSNCSSLAFERIVYMTDLRYCKPSVVRFLAKFARPYASKLLLGHLSASGLPDMALDYAISLFKETVATIVDYSELAFNNIKERNVEKALDVLVQGMNTDMLVLMNHQYHFKQIIGNSTLPNRLSHISIPIMVFPF